MTKSLFAAFAAALLSLPLAAQTYQGSVSLTGSGNPITTAKPFGIVADEATQSVWVALCGDLAPWGGNPADYNNNAVVRIDTATDTVAAVIPVGLYPEDLVVVRDAAGAALLVAVTNSTSGTVSFVDMSDTVVATVSLPDPFGMGTCYPFGITWCMSSNRVLVTTQDGSGEVYSIDPSTFTLDAAGTFNTAAAGGRPTVHGTEMIIPRTTYNATWTGASVDFTAWETVGMVGNPIESFLVERQDPGFPSGSEVVRVGNDYLFCGMGCGDRLYLVESGSYSYTLSRTIPLSTYGDGLYGMGVSSDERLLAACDLLSNKVALVDMLNQKEVALLDPWGDDRLTMPNDAAFANGKLYVTCQGNEAVAVYGNLPSPIPGGGYSGSLAVDRETPYVGTSGHTVTISGSGKVAILGSWDDRPTPIPVGGLTAEIGPTIGLLAVGSGVATYGYGIPDRTELVGRKLFFQGVVDATSVAPQTTRPQVVIFQ